MFNSITFLKLSRDSNLFNLIMCDGTVFMMMMRNRNTILKLQSYIQSAHNVSFCPETNLSEL